MFFESPAPHCLFRPSPRLLGERKRPPIFHITELGHIYSHLPSKIDAFFEGATPHAAADRHRPG